MCAGVSINSEHNTDALEGGELKTTLAQYTRCTPGCLGTILRKSIHVAYLGLHARRSECDAQECSSDSALNDSHPGACTVTGHGQDSEGSGKVHRPNMKACINFHSFLVGSATTCLAHVV